jgi:hypothetical protein
MSINIHNRNSKKGIFIRGMAVKFNPGAADIILGNYILDPAPLAGIPADVSPNFTEFTRIRPDGLVSTGFWGDFGGFVWGIFKYIIP